MTIRPRRSVLYMPGSNARALEKAKTLPADGVSGATRAPGTQTIRVPGARLNGLQPGQYNIVVEAARELGGRETVRVPFRWGAANSGQASGSTELGAVRVNVTR